MCNDAIRIALKEKPKSRFRLIELAYPRLKEYGLRTHYILSACEVAYAAYSNTKRTSDPYVRRHFIKLDSQTYALNHLVLRIPTRPRHFIYLTLRSSNYHLSFVDEPSLKRVSITLNDSILAIVFSGKNGEIEPRGRVGIDVNERNVTWSDSSGWVAKEDTSPVAELKERYKAVRAKIAERTSKDRRIQRGLLSKYGKREKDRTAQAIHRVTKRIVEHAKANNQAIVMERLKGIRKLYRKGNGQGASFRGRMNSWAFREVQRQIEYKARWEGIPVHYVNPRGTSRKCPSCGSSLVELEGRRLMCPSCKQIEDRDVIASKNIMACVVPQARPSKGSREGERPKDGANPLSRWMEGASPEHAPELTRDTAPRSARAVRPLRRSSSPKSRRA
jgi:putative transposase